MRSVAAESSWRLCGCGPVGVARSESDDDHRRRGIRVAGRGCSPGSERWRSRSTALSSVVDLGRRQRRVACGCSRARRSRRFIQAVRTLESASRTAGYERPSFRMAAASVSVSLRLSSLDCGNVPGRIVSTSSPSHQRLAGAADAALTDVTPGRSPRRRSDRPAACACACRSCRTADRRRRAARRSRPAARWAADASAAAS